MKTRLNLTIEDNLLRKTKIYARRHNTSVSNLVEDYFKNLSDDSKPKYKNIVELIESLPAPKIKLEGDLKNLYYEEQKTKHGF